MDYSKIPYNLYVIRLEDERYFIHVQSAETLYDANTDKIMNNCVLLYDYVKQYKPKETSPWTIPKDDLDFKPGFLEQYKEFHRMVQGESRRFGASLRDCQLALNLANSLENGGLVNF